MSDARDEQLPKNAEPSLAPASVPAAKVGAKLAKLSGPLPALERELELFKTIEPFAAQFVTARLAAEMSAPAVAHLQAFATQLEQTRLFANRAILDQVAMAAAVATPSFAILQDALRSTAWASTLATMTLPPPSVMAGLTEAVSAMSLDLSRHIALQAKLIADIKFSLPASALGQIVESARFAAFMTGPIASALATFEAARLTRKEIRPVGFASMAASGLTGLVLPSAPYRRPRVFEDLESEVRAAGIELIRNRHPRIAQKLEGAKFALRGPNPDGISQAANSLVEATDQFLRSITDGDQVVAWCAENYADGIYIRESGERAPTRAGRINYLAHVYGVSSKIGTSIGLIVTSATAVMQQAKHATADEGVVRNYILIVEGSIGAIVAMLSRES